MNRRQFARALVALGGLSVAAGVPGGPRELYIVRDTRIADLDMLCPLTPAGTHRVHTFDGDVTRLWLDVLRPAWRDARVATMGYTRHAEFFVLSTLARDHGYVVAATDERAQSLTWLLLPGDSPRVDERVQTHH